MNGGVMSDLATLEFKKVEQLEYFRSRVISLQQEVILSGETVSPERLLFHYMKSLSKSDKLKSFIAPNMIDLITILDKNEKSDVYSGGDITGLYRYLEMIVSPTILTTSGQSSCHFRPSYSTNNDTETTHPFIAAILVRQNLICK